MKIKNPYHFFDTYCLRTPTLSYTDYLTTVNKEQLSASFYDTLWKNKTFKEAVYLASPAFYDEAEKYSTDDTLTPQRKKQIQNTLLKYYVRAASRCTPFGLFAGCSVGHFNDRSLITLLPHTSYKRATRFDMNFLVAFMQTLIEEQPIKEQLTWFTNTSLYVIGDQYRYMEYVYKHNRRHYSLEAVITSSHLDTLLKKASKGATITALANSISTSEIPIEEATAFVTILIENQLLTSEIEPNVTGDDYFTQIQKLFAKLSNTQAQEALFMAWNNTLLKLDISLENDSTHYEKLYNDIHDVFKEVDKKYLLQVDLFPKTKHNTLHKKIGYDLLKVMPFLNRINSTPHKTTRLNTFKKTFTKRYETREIPLIVALDLEVGIGYNQHIDAKDDTSFLKDFNIIPKQDTTKSISWSKIDTLLFKKLEDIKTTSESIIYLTDNDLIDFPETWNNLPDTLSAMVEILKVNGEELLSLGSFGGASANDLLGRFSSGNSDIKKHTENIAAVEQQINSNSIIADILHLPEARLGNILQRASLSDYDISYLANSLADKDKQIAIDDLYISVKNNRVILRSKKHNKQIIPRLYNAHNYRKEGALPIYQFLCELQTDEKRASLSFNWSAVFTKISFLPRVVYKNIILSKARWKIISKEYNEGVTTLAANNTWRTLHKISQWVLLVEGDNTLPLNLLNTACIELLQNHAKKNKSFILEEFLFTEDLLVKQGDKGFTNQCVISFYNNEKLTKSNQL